MSASTCLRGFVLIGVAAGALVLVTRRDFSQPNLRLFAEMADSPAARSQDGSSVLPDGRVLQLPPKGTIPRGFKPLHLEPTEADRKRAGLELKNPVKRTLATLARGRHVYENFCLHCHGAKGAGDGGVARVFTAFSMPVNGKATRDLPDGEIFHIVSFGRNNMPPHRSQVQAQERWQLVHYLRELQAEEAERLAKAGQVAEEDPRPRSLVSAEYGHELYDANCAACHGPGGRQPVQGVPTLNVARVLSVAGDDYYREIIAHGRKGTKMPAWDRMMTPTQIQSLVAHIRSWQPPELDRSKVAVAAGDAHLGEALYRGNCSGCHGARGKGGIGISLTAPSFLALATDSFLRDTIARGRSHTAMPAGIAFSASEVSDLLAYLRSFSKPRHTYEQVAALLPGASRAVGAKLFRSRCAACHGAHGQGGIGSRLDVDGFLAMVDDRFLYRAIVEGRPGTAMPAWHHLTAADVADLIAHLRGWQKSPPAVARHARAPGRWEFGELLYQQSCQSCHGPDGRGGVGAQIANPVFLASASDEFLFRSISAGKDGTAMRGFGKGATGGTLATLSDADIDHLVAYLRHLGDRPRVEPLRRPASSVSVQLGREIYESRASCAKCHGYSGEGGTGPALGNRQFLATASDGFLIGTIVMGREGSAMVPFSGAGAVELNSSDIENVVAYIRSFEGQPPRPRRLTEASDATLHEGQLLFGTHCAACHGAEGKGPSNARIKGYAPSLNNPQFLKAADDGLLLATIALGRPGTPMRGFSKGAGGISELSVEDIRKIVAYIRSWEGAP